MIADPAADAPLPGALEEGEVVASIFERFARDTDQPVEVQRLFGPAEATPAAVRKCLRTRYWDIIHFAGHGFLCDSDPSKSGWLFRADPLQTVTAEELASGSHAPYLVYFDACASGTSRDCRWLLARKLAEPFANCGVSNLICITPREDQASLDFTRRLYDKFFHYLWSAKPEDALAEAVSSARSHLAAQGGPPTGILVFQCSNFSIPQPEENHASFSTSAPQVSRVRWGLPRLTYSLRGGLLQPLQKIQELGVIIAAQNRFAGIRFPSDAAHERGFKGWNLVMFRDAVIAPAAVVFTDDTGTVVQTWP